MSFALLSRFLTNKPPGKFLPLKLRFTFFKAIFRKIKIYTYIATETAYKIVQYFAEQCKGPQVPALGLISLVPKIKNIMNCLLQETSYFFTD